MTNKYRAEVAAPEFGVGYTIRLDMDGFGKLETELGDFTAYERLMLGLPRLSPKCIKAFLAAALRKDDAVVKDFVMPEDAPVSAIAAKCHDALCLFLHGKNADDWAAESKAKAEAATANPTKGTGA